LTQSLLAPTAFASKAERSVLPVPVAETMSAFVFPAPRSFAREPSVMND